MEKGKRCTISDIAQEVGVSTTTVSRYLAGNYRNMSAATQDRIKRTIEKYNYRPSLVARGLKNNRTFLIGVVMPQVHTYSSGHGIRSICAACTAFQYSPIIVSIENDISKEDQRIRELLDHRVDGILTFTGSNEEQYVDVIRKGTPVVRVDRYTAPLAIDSVYINNYESSLEALQNLAASGYSSIAMIRNSKKTGIYSAANRRIQAFRTFAQNNPQINTIDCDLETVDVAAVRSFIQNYSKHPTAEKRAVFVPSMLDTATVNWAFWQVPEWCREGTAIVANSVEGDPMLGTKGMMVIMQPIAEMSRVALSLLSSRIEKGLSPIPEERVIPAKII